MSKVAKAVQGFLKSMEWGWQEMGPTRYRVVVTGRTAQWVWVAHWEEDDSLFATYSVSPIDVPAKQRPAAAEYLMRANYNLRLGNFEMDYSDGQVCLKTSMVMSGVRPTVDLVKRLAFASFSTMDQYLPGLMSVIYGKARPKAAIEEAERPEKEEPEEDDGQEDAPQGQESESETPAQGAVLAGRRGQLVAQTRRPMVARAKRTAQFVRYLHLMDKRVHGEAEGSCFLVFSRPFDPTVPGANQDPSTSPRMVQFRFDGKWFAIDIPSTNLCPDEAERILKERRGFYREAEHPEVGVTTNVNDLVRFDPIGKKYIYGDEREAAQDAAYVFYDVWGLTPDTEMLVTAAAFNGPSWEKDVPLE
jgi:hypothetical protein